MLAHITPADWPAALGLLCLGAALVLLVQRAPLGDRLPGPRLYAVYVAASVAAILNAAAVLFADSAGAAETTAGWYGAGLLVDALVLARLALLAPGPDRLHRLVIPDRWLRRHRERADLRRRPDDDEYDGGPPYRQVKATDVSRFPGL
jgi:hypothetical protein